MCLGEMSELTRLWIKHHVETSTPKTRRCINSGPHESFQFNSTQRVAGGRTFNRSVELVIAL